MTSVSEQHRRLTRAYRRYRLGLRDFGAGLVAFHGLGLLASGVSWVCGSARASIPDSITARAIDATSPPGTGSENAVMEAVLFGASVLHKEPRAMALLVLGLTLSFLLAMNLALVRHLRRAYAAPRRLKPGWIR